MHGGAYPVIKNKPAVRILDMDTTLLRSDENRKKMLADLENKYGVVFKPMAQAVEDAVLERLLTELERQNKDVAETRTIENRSAAYDRYVMMIADYLCIPTILTALFASYPWMKLWWPWIQDYRTDH